MPKRHPVTGKLLVEIPQTVETTTVSSSAAVIEEFNPVVIKEEPVVQSEKAQAEKLQEAVATLKEQLDPELTVDDDWTKVQLDNSELTSFMGCPQKYEYQYEMNLISVDGISKPYTKGTIYHQAINAYWRERIKSGDYQEAVKLAINIAKAAFEKEVSFSREERLDALSNLLEFLRFIQGWNGIPLESEKYFNILAFEDVENKTRIFLNGRIDLIARLPQISVLPIDFKTESERWFHSQLTNQYRIYSIACGVNVLGVQRIGSQTTLEAKDKFKLEYLPFDQDILDEFRTIQLPYWIRQMLIANETKFYPMNTTDCVHGHFKCQFSDAYNGGICNVSRAVRQQKLNRYFKVREPWDPSKDPSKAQ